MIYWWIIGGIIFFVILIVFRVFLEVAYSYVLFFISELKYMLARRKYRKARKLLEELIEQFESEARK
jgi:hypothetical protein